MSTYDVVIVGAGHNGLVCAAYLLKAGYSVALMMSMRHNPGMARPRGGTGALTKALVRLVKEKGGVILCDRPVESVLISNSGRAEGVITANGEEYRAKTAVISNIDARRLFLNLIPAPATDGGCQEYY